MTPEGQVKREITQALKQLGYTPYRIQCGRWKVRGGWMHGAPDGTPDLLVPVLLRGVSKAIMWLETKQVGGKLRDAQKRFAAELPPAEFHVVADGLDSVLDFLTRHGCRPR